MKLVFAVAGFLVLAGCSGLPIFNRAAPEVVEPATDNTDPLAQIRPVLRPGASGQSEPADLDLGTTIVSLGAPTDPGLWLKTPLVGQEVTGRVQTAGQWALVAACRLRRCRRWAYRLPNCPKSRCFGASLAQVFCSLFAGKRLHCAAVGFQKRDYSYSIMLGEFAQPPCNRFLNEPLPVRYIRGSPA